MKTDIVIGGAPLLDFRDHVRRYCGLSWSGGDPEVWAYPFYDRLPDHDPDRVTAADLVAVATVHPNLTKADLEWFVTERTHLDDLLGQVDQRTYLGEAPDSTLAALAQLTTTCESRLALATRVLHRKRPRSIPLFGRHLVDRYHRGLGTRGEAAWPELLDALAADLTCDDNRASLDGLRAELAGELAHVPSNLRLVDIAIWMDAR